MSGNTHPQASSSQSSHDNNGVEHHGHQIYDDVLAGAQDRPWIPRLRSDPPPYHPLSLSLQEFRQREGHDSRKQRLKETWERLPSTTIMQIRRDLGPLKATKLTREEAQQLEGAYEDELLGRCNGKKIPGEAGLGKAQVSWKEFKKYAEDKEAGARVLQISCLLGCFGH
jgi:solute carrier family 25 (mitochondrial phosphate transporter), member 23/24/25/41